MNNNILMGDRLKQARKAMGMTQAYVAERMGMARTTVVAIEKGERGINREERLLFQALYATTFPEIEASDLPPRFDPDDPRLQRLMLITPSGEAGKFAGAHNHPGLAWVQIEGSKERRAFSISELTVMRSDGQDLTLDSVLNSLRKAALLTCGMAMILEQIEPEAPPEQQRLFDDLQKDLTYAYEFFYGASWESLLDYTRRESEKRKGEQNDD